MLSKVCKGCGSLYYNINKLKPSSFNKSKYCSRQCYYNNTSFQRNIKDYTSEIINNIKVIKPNGRAKGGSITYDCLCFCGKIFKTRISRLKNGSTKSCGCLRHFILSNLAKARIGEKSNRWNKNLTNEQRISRRGFGKIKDLRNNVYERDGYKCVLCENGGKLNAHHLNGWNWYISGRYDINNCVTLCVKCHDRFHSIYGKGFNTKDEFNEFRRMYD